MTSSTQWFHPKYQSFSPTQRKLSFLDPQCREEDETLPERTGTARLMVCVQRSEFGGVSCTQPTRWSLGGFRPPSHFQSVLTHTVGENRVSPANPSHSSQGALRLFTCLWTLFGGRDRSFFSDLPERLRFVAAQQGGGIPVYKMHGKQGLLCAVDCQKISTVRICHLTITTNSP